MCGLAGIVGLPRAGAAETLQVMVAAQRHRGPDDSGCLWLEAPSCHVGLGHCRLAIQDLSPHGRQPMCSPRTGSVLIYNGEIYNAPVLRRELQAAGHAFAGHSDTEVLLAALDHWGDKALRRLQGMFAFAWWEPRRRTLLLARDPLGIKPLHVQQRGDTLLFASEQRALLAVGDQHSALDQAALASLLAYGAVQPPHTLLEDVRVFPAGCLQRFQVAADGRLQSLAPVRHWSLPAPCSTLSFAAATEQLRADIDSAVRAHLLSDVPVGVFLSSGLDSTIVATLAARAQPDLRAFTVGFPEDAAGNELALAAATAQRLGLRHEALVLSEAEATAQVLPWLQSLDAPCIDGVNAYVISRATRAAGVSVALSGQGGDELFGGYPSFREVPLLLRARRGLAPLPAGARRALVRALANTLGRAAARRRGPHAVDKLADAFGGAADAFALTLQRRRCFADAQIAALLGDGTALRVQAQRLYLDQEALPPLPDSLRRDAVAAVSAAETQAYLGHTLLPAGDHGSMAHGLEMRVPLLDRKVLDLALSLPGSIRLPRPRADKALLRAAFAAELPGEITAQAKRGFVLPLRRWMRGPLRPVCEAAFATLRAHPAFEAGAVDAVWRDYELAPESPAWSRAWLLTTLGHYLGRTRA